MNCPTCGFSYVLSDTCYKCPSPETVVTAPDLTTTEAIIAPIRLELLSINAYLMGAVERLYSIIERGYRIGYTRRMTNTMDHTKVVVSRRPDGLSIDNFILIFWNKSSNKVMFSSQSYKQCTGHFHLLYPGRNPLCLYDKSLSASATQILDDLNL